MQSYGLTTPLVIGWKRGWKKQITPLINAEPPMDMRYVMIEESEFIGSYYTLMD